MAARREATPMDEASFWSKLNWHICREFAGMADGHMRNFWCDEMAPYAWYLEGSTPRIVGIAFIGNTASTDENGSSRYSCRLAIPRSVRRRPEQPMIAGVVSTMRDALLRVVLYDSDGHPQSLNALVDTGFDRWIALPAGGNRGTWASFAAIRKRRLG